MAWKFVAHLKEYCTNCTLAGLSYIANHRLHFTERLFWLICFLLSALGSYFLINHYAEHFEHRAVSIVYESQPPHQPIYFPSVSVCSMKDRGKNNSRLEEYVRSLRPGEVIEQNYFDVEDFINIMRYPYDYLQFKIRTSCVNKKTGELKCPENNYRDLVKMFQPNCTDFFHYCSLGGKPFDCCRYFLPLTLPYGKCFALNSLINNKPGTATWFNTAIDQVTGNSELKLTTKTPMRATFLNEEDIAYIHLPSIFAHLSNSGDSKQYKLFVEEMVNDPDVADLSIESRKCRYPHELLPGSGHRAYSFSTCYMDCLRIYQMKHCNCTFYSFLPEPVEQYPDCNLKGLLCLEEKHLFKPEPSTLVPWSPNFRCQCLPSCDESDLQLIYESHVQHSESNTCNLTVSMPGLPAHRYRRQSLRTRLDVVVTIGGILGLYMGASILSVMELFYYFSIRLYSSSAN